MSEPKIALAPPAPTYDSAHLANPALQEFREVWQKRELLWQMVKNTIKTRYKRSTLGVLWMLLNPLLNTAILSLAFIQIFKVQVLDYPVYLMSGIISFNLFSQTTSAGITTTVWGSGLLKRIYIPNTIFVLSVLGNSIINFAFASVALVIVALFLQHPIGLGLLTVVLPLIPVALFSIGIALLVGTVAVFFPDMVDIYNVSLQMWFYLTPIMYPLEIVDEKNRWLFQLNPLYHLVTSMRASLYDNRLANVNELLISFGIGLVVFLLGWTVFTYRSKDFAYRL
ncbi:MAG TPA: ABC transporter permease [Anaerolineales bacterium]|nr:ABC transporter permease [Anaerolineales bacterium]